MKYLNLVDIEKSDILYKIYNFPDGQNQMVITLPIYDIIDDGIDVYSKKIKKSYPIQIKARLNNFQDLEKIICATKSLRALGVKEIHLYTPYFLGSRSDRKFEEGSNNYLKDVICPIINSLNFDSITVIDPHSDVLEACLNNFKKVDNLNLIKFTIKDLDKDFAGDLFSNIVLISPDAGANKKIFKVAEQIDYTGDIITCSKSRDEQGKLSHVVVPIKYEETKDIIIIDDICDGGATFNNISAALNDAGHQGKKYLIVTHGIFSKGFDDLFKYFDGVYCTNSYRNICEIEYNREFNVKQLNVF